MNKLHTIPAADGFRMPGEFEPHRGCIMIWPKRPGSWNYGAKKAREAVKRVAWASAESEEVFMLAEPDVEENAREMLAGNPGHGIHVIRMESDDAWARDVAPTFVVNGEGTVRGIDWEFNAWGGTVDGLYAHWEKDDLVAEKVCGELGYDCYEAHPFVLEGGSIHSDGEGTVLVTAACLLSGGRNPKLTKDEIGKKLCAYLGAKKVIWLERGIYNDETNEHVDNICAFVRPGEVACIWTDDEDNPFYEAAHAAYETLSNATDAKGRALKVHKLTMPKEPVYMTQEEVDAIDVVEGTIPRTTEDVCIASYMNFLIGNDFVLVPQYDDEYDEMALQQVQQMFPEREVVGVPTREVVYGGGNIHCITQQQPAGV